jgi:hypothetical protein
MVAISEIVSIMATICNLTVNTIGAPNVSAQYMTSSGYTLLKIK